MIAVRAHNVSTSPGRKGAKIECSCGFKANGDLLGTREAKRLAFAHVAYPECTILELIQGPPCEATAA